MQLQSNGRKNGNMQLVDFGELQARYQAMTLAKRASAVLKDAAPALAAAEQILSALAAHPRTKQVFERMRRDQALIGKMRPSEARNMLLDGSCDFVDVTRRKLAAWRKTMERLGEGEGIISEKSGEYISSQVPLALALSSIAAVGNYLSIVQLALAELAKADADNALHYNSMLTKARRSAIWLSDCETAASFCAVVH